MATSSSCEASTDSEAVNLFSSAVVSAMKKTPSESSRAKNVKKLGEEVLKKMGSQGGRYSCAVHTLSEGLVKYFREEITTEGSKYKATRSKRQKLWTIFHSLRTKQNRMSILWKDFTTEMELPASSHMDPLFKQAILQELFEACMLEYFSKCKSNTDEFTNTASVDHSLSDVEANVIRFVGGYVARSLLRKYEKMKDNNEMYSQFIDCLGEMSVEGEGDDAITYTRNWFDLINRGGLYPINDLTYILFVRVEMCVRSHLPKHILSVKRQDEQGDVAFKRHVHNKVLEDEDLLFYWALLSQDIDTPENSESLLKDIVSLWITIRGYSIASSWMEEFKCREKKNTQKCVGLRKSMSGN